MMKHLWLRVIKDALKRGVKVFMCRLAVCKLTHSPARALTLVALTPSRTNSRRAKL